MGTKAPGVTVLRPLKGVDNNIRANLEASFLIQYPRFEVLFMVAEPADPVVGVVEELMQRYPHVDAKLLIGRRSMCVCACVCDV